VQADAEDRNPSKNIQRSFIEASHQALTILARLGKLQERGKLDAGRRRSTIPQCRRRERQRELATNQYDPRQIRLAAKVSF